MLLNIIKKLHHNIKNEGDESSLAMGFSFVQIATKDFFPVLEGDCNSGASAVVKE